MTTSTKFKVSRINNSTAIIIHLANLFKTLEGVVDGVGKDIQFGISDEEYAENILKEVANLQGATYQPDPTQASTAPAPISGDAPMLSPPPNLPDSNQLPTPMISSPEMKATSGQLLEVRTSTETKINQAIKDAQTANNPASQLQNVLDELSEDTSMLTSWSHQQQQDHQIQSLQYLCNALIKNAKLAERMTRVVNAGQVTKAVNKAILMEDLNPVNLSLQQFLQHPLSHTLWTVVSAHNSDFVEDSQAWGRWWMAMIESPNPKQRLRRSLHHLNQFNQLANATFTEFGTNPTRSTTEWLVIQLVRLGDHLLSSHIKSEFGFNWPYNYQKVAAHIARNKMTHVRDIFAALEPLWPCGVKLNFHYNQPSFTDCVLELSEPDTAAGKIPHMKKMRHNHDQIFGGPHVGNRYDSDDDVNDSRMMEPETPPRPSKVPRMQPELMQSSDDDLNMDEPRRVRSYADLLK